MSGLIRIFVIVIFMLVPLFAQNQNLPSPTKPSSAANKGVDYLLNYLNMAGTMTASEFRPLTQKERNNDYVKTLVNPLSFAKAGFSAGLDQWNDKPPEWEQGASGYGKRFANILSQYTIQRSVTFGLASALHDDNRYFNSGKKGVWSRTGYALSSGILARAEDGSRHVSISQLGGVAAGAFISRTWQPASHHSAGDGAISFGITMASNMGTGVLKEFLPDLGRIITNKRNKHSKQLATINMSSESAAEFILRLRAQAKTWDCPTRDPNVQDGKRNTERAGCVTTSSCSTKWAMCHWLTSERRSCSK